MVSHNLNLGRQEPYFFSETHFVPYTIFNTLCKGNNSGVREVQNKRDFQI